MNDQENNINFNIALTNLENIINSQKKENISFYSDLTARELEICEFIKIGLPNKIIANNSNVSIHTIERHRFNIRNKLALTPTDNLSNYLKKI